MKRADIRLRASWTHAFAAALLGAGLLHGQSLSVTPNPAMPGQNVYVTGNDFPPGATITVSVAGNQQSVISDSAGSLSAGPFSIPSNARGAMMLATASGGASASGSFSVQTPPMGVFPSAQSVRAGGAAQFSGNGFAPSEMVEVHESGILAAQSMTTVNGDFGISIPAPPNAAGQYRIYNFRGQQSGITASATVTFAAPGAAPTPQTAPSSSATLTVNRTFLQPGQSVTASGFGFAPTEEVAILLDAAEIGSTNASSAGTISYTFTPPKTARDVLVLRARGRISGATGTAGLMVRERPNQ